MFTRQTVNIDKYMDHEVVKPQPGGQTRFLAASEFEVLYGGAAGPGKSWALIIDALGCRYIHTELGRAAFEQPGYKAVIFRRNATQLTQLIEEGKKYYIPLGAEFVQHRVGTPGPSFTFPSGAVIFLCHMNEEADKENHQGIEYQFVGFDELTQFTLTQYLYLFSRLRSTIKHLDPRMRSTTNPTGEGLMWVKKRFIKNSDLELIPGKTYYFKPDPAADDIQDNPQGVRCSAFDRWGKSRTFIPGLLHENKILLEADPQYQLNIMAMGAQYERALLYGDWDAFGGTFFKDFSRKRHVVKPFMIHPDVPIYATLDPGWTSPCSIGAWAVYPNKLVRLFTYYFKDLSAEQHAKNFKQMMHEFPYTRRRQPAYIIAGKDAFNKKEKGAQIEFSRSFEKQFMDKGFTLVKAKTDRVLGWMTVKSLYRHDQVEIFDSYNGALLDETTSALPDEKVPEDIKGKGNDPNVSDHAIDEFRYGAVGLIQFMNVEKLITPAWVQIYEQGRKKEEGIKNLSEMAG